MSQSPKIAYVKLEGVLYSQTVFHHAAYLAANHQGMSQRVLRLGQAMLSRQVARFLDTNAQAFGSSATHHPPRAPRRQYPRGPSIRMALANE